jgi:uncharacterized membrane protein (DUF485 family)
METRETVITPPPVAAHPVTAPPPRGERSVTELIRELRDESTLLLKQEMALARSEMSEKFSKFSRNAVYLAVGGMIAYAGLIFLLLMLTALMFTGLTPNVMTAGTALWIAPGIVGLVIGVVGYALIQKAISTFSRESFTPEKTIRSLTEDKQWTQEKLSRA